MNERKLVNEIWQKINDHRRSKGLSDLDMKSEITEVCQIHTDNMAFDRIPLGHYGFSSRADILLKRLHGVKAAENVIFGPPIAEQLIQGWLLSDAHRRNLEGDYSLTGIAVSPHSSGSVYVSQIFLKTIQLATISAMPPSVYYDGNGNQVPFLSMEPLLEMVNLFRREKNLQPLHQNEQLEEIAKNYIIDYIGKRQAFGHSGFSNRAEEALNRCEGISYVENIAKGPADATAVFESWINSQAHSEHLKGTFDQTGIAIGGSDEDGYIYVQLFLESDK